MSSNRLMYDSCAYEKSLQQSTSPLNYALYTGKYENTAKCRIEFGLVGGNGVSQYSGNLVDLESDLRGVNRHLSRDCLGKDEYQKYNVPNQAIQYPTCTQLTTEQSRATNPAWWYRDLEQNNFEYPPLNPQANVCIPFQSNLNTRILEKDYFTPKRDCVLEETKNMLPTSYNLIRGNYVGGPTSCTQTNSCQNIN